MEKVKQRSNLARHGPEVPDSMLVRRIITGFVFDPSCPTELVWSPTDSATRFLSYGVMLQARREGLTAIREKLEMYPFWGPQAVSVSYALVVQHKMPIGMGFVGTGPTRTISFGTDCRTAFTSTTAINGLTRSRIRVKWDANADAGVDSWYVTQLFPMAEYWDQAAQAYRSLSPTDEFYEIP